MKALVRIFAVVLIGFAVWTCTESDPDKPDTLTLTLNDTLKASSLKYDSIKIDLYTVRGSDSTYAKTLFHGPYTDAAQLTNLELGFLADGNFSLKLIGFRDGVKVLELGLGFSGGDPGPATVISITAPDTPKVIITWPLIGHVTNQDSIVIQWGVDSANTGLVVRPPRVFHLDEGEMPLTILDTNGRGIVGGATIHVTRVAGVLFVNAAALDSGDGNSWATAYRNLQTALARATDGWDIWAAKGIYRPFEGTGLDSTTGDTSFVMKSGVDLFGGFAGTEGARDLRNWGINETVLSGERGDTVITDNAGPILLGANNATLDGFVVERGFTQTQIAAGMVNENLSPQITHCVFRNNISRNPNRGSAGIYNGASNANISNCQFLNNSSDDAGVILNVGGSPTFTSCLFQGNRGVSSGGIENTGLATPVILSSFFANNHADNSGGAITNTQATSTILNSIFIGNSAAQNGGAIFAGGSAVLKNSVFTGNTALNGGALSSHSPLSITNCTFFANNASDSGGAVFYESFQFSGKSSVRNSILWGNYATLGSEISAKTDSVLADTIEIIYSDVYMGSSPFQTSSTFTIQTGAGYLNDPPLFKNTADLPGLDGLYFTSDDGLSLLESSPCLNTGDPVSTGTATPEMTGGARIQGSAIDIGAYEQ